MKYLESGESFRLGKVLGRKWLVAIKITREGSHLSSHVERLCMKQGTCKGKPKVAFVVTEEEFNKYE